VHDIISHRHRFEEDRDRHASPTGTPEWRDGRSGSRYYDRLRASGFGRGLLFSADQKSTAA
jgi:hypothetical protein